MSTNQQESHAGIILVPASFRGDEFALLADAIAPSVATFPQVLADLVLFLNRTGPSLRNPTESRSNLAG